MNPTANKAIPLRNSLEEALAESKATGKHVLVLNAGQGFGECGL